MNWRAIQDFLDDYDFLVDIAVVDAGLDRWQRLLSFVASSNYGVSLTLNGTPVTTLPAASEIFASRANVTWLLRIHVGSVDAHCHFFDPDVIVLDIPAREIASDGEAEPIFAFMHVVADVVGRECRLTPENMHEVPLVRALPGGSGLIWDVPNNLATPN